MLARPARLTLHHVVNVESGLDQKNRRLYTAAGSAVNRHGHRAFIAAGRRHPTHRRGGSKGRPGGRGPHSKLCPLCPPPNEVYDADILTEVYVIASLGLHYSSAVCQAVAHLLAWLLYCPPPFSGIAVEPPLLAHQVTSGNKSSITQPVSAVDDTVSPLRPYTPTNRLLPHQFIQLLQSADNKYLSPPKRLCFHRRQFVCERDFVKTTQPIFTKFGDTIGI